LDRCKSRGTATHVDPGAPVHGRAVEALRAKYDQYADHALEGCPVLQIAPGKSCRGATSRSATTSGS